MHLPPSRLRLITAIFALVWTVTTLNWLGLRFLPDVFYWVVFPLSAPLAGAWIHWSRRQGVIVRNLVLSVCFIFVWQLLVFLADEFALDRLRVGLARGGLFAAFLLGLVWVVWAMERAAQYYERKQPQDDETTTVWNPFDLSAWYYGLAWSVGLFNVAAWFRFLFKSRTLPRSNRSRRLDQSLTGLLAYSIVFTTACLTLTQLRGCREIYEMPAGGGEQAQIAQQVRIEKIIRKKFVVNPLSVIRFDVPPIDEVTLELNELTRHAYTVGYGQGAGAGFAGGTKEGRVRLIRLEYNGGDWDHNFGVGGDLNMLMEYGIRTQHKVASRTESRHVAQLANFPVGESPPLVYLTGQRNISLSNSEIKILQEYLFDKHGMLFIDNAGSRHFHNQAISLMNRVAPNIRPTSIPLDDVIHRIPYSIPFFPYVSPHGGKEALGWWDEDQSRWVCYYHPGDIGDAWADEHAGVSPEIWQACYQLGTNVIFYAHSEYSKWQTARESTE